MKRNLQNLLSKSQMRNVQKILQTVNAEAITVIYLAFLHTHIIIWG